jgi:pyruvate dehydrogenase E1 component alpha subunit
MKDPIERVRAYLTKNELADDGFFEAVDAEADELGKRVRDDCRALPDPRPEAIYEHVYAGAHAQLDEERAAFASYLEGFTD